MNTRVDLPAPAGARQETQYSSTRMEDPRRPKTNRSEFSSSAHAAHNISVPVGNANVGCQGTFVTNNFFVSPATKVRPEAAGGSGPTTQEEDTDWVAQLTNMLLLCSGCAIAQQLAKKFQEFTHRPAKERQALVLAELQNPDCQHTVLGAVFADLEARFTLCPDKSRAEVWSASVAKVVTEALCLDLTSFKRMNELCTLFVNNPDREVPAQEVLAITAGPSTSPSDLSSCDVPSVMTNASELAAHANLMLRNIGRPAATHSPGVAFGTAAATQLLKELARSGRRAVVHEFELPNNPIECYAITDIRKRGNGVSAERVLHPASRGGRRVDLPRPGWFIVAVAAVPAVSDDSGAAANATQ